MTTSQLDRARTSDVNLLTLVRRPPLAIRLLGLVVASSLLSPGLLALKIGPLFLPVYRVVLFAALVVIIAGRPRRASGSSRPTIIAAIWMVACIVTLLASPTRAESFGTFLNYAFDAVVVLVLYRSIRGRVLVICVAQALACLVLVSAVLAVAEYLRGSYLVPEWLVSIRTRSRFGNIRGQGLAPHPLVLGMLCSLTLFAAPTAWARRARLAWWVVLGLGILASQSRGPILAALVGYLVLMIARVDRRLARKLVPILIGGLVIVLALLPGDARTDNTGEAASSAAYRTALVRLAGDAVSERPLGLGFGQLSGGVGRGYLLRRFNGSTLDFGNSIDNQFVLTLLYGGLPLLAGLLAISALSIAALRRATDAPLLGMFVCLFGSMLFLGLLSFPVSAFAFWTAVAVATSSPPRQK